jgi:hypothetical protein
MQRVARRIGQADRKCTFGARQHTRVVAPPGGGTIIIF